MTTTMNVDDKHHYASLASLAAMMITVTTHRLHAKPGLTGHWKCIKKRYRKSLCISSIPSSDDDNHRYASLACQAGSNGTLEVYRKDLRRRSMTTIMRVDDRHDYASLASLAGMITVATHRLHVKPCLTGQLKCK